MGDFFGLIMVAFVLMRIAGVISESQKKYKKSSNVDKKTIYQNKNVNNKRGRESKSDSIFQSILDAFDESLQKTANETKTIITKKSKGKQSKQASTATSKTRVDHSMEHVPYEENYLKNRREEEAEQKRALEEKMEETEVALFDFDVHNTQKWREAFVYTEILSKPVSMREE